MKQIRIENLILKIEQVVGGKFRVSIDHGFGRIERVDDYKTEQEAFQFVVAHLALSMGVAIELAELVERVNLSGRIPLQHA
jgi:hypothetical protein